jgi:hypothetical protein
MISQRMDNALDAPFETNATRWLKIDLLTPHCKPHVRVSHRPSRVAFRPGARLFTLAMRF